MSEICHLGKVTLSRVPSPRETPPPTERQATKPMQISARTAVTVIRDRPTHARLYLVIHVRRDRDRDTALFPPPTPHLLNTRQAALPTPKNLSTSTLYSAVFCAPDPLSTEMTEPEETPAETPPEASFEERLKNSLSNAYDIERELGGGGMSRVFVATDRLLGERSSSRSSRPSSPRASTAPGSAERSRSPRSSSTRTSSRSSRPASTATSSTTRCRSSRASRSSRRSKRRDRCGVEDSPASSL